MKNYKAYPTSTLRQLLDCPFQQQVSESEKKAIRKEIERRSK